MICLFQTLASLKWKNEVQQREDMHAQFSLGQSWTPRPPNGLCSLVAEKCSPVVSLCPWSLGKQRQVWPQAQWELQCVLPVP